MTGPRKVMLIVDAVSPAPAAGELADALREIGAEVQSQPLVPPYDSVLDALAEGWLPIYVGNAALAAPP